MISRLRLLIVAVCLVFMASPAAAITLTQKETKAIITAGKKVVAAKKYLRNSAIFSSLVGRSFLVGVVGRASTPTVTFYSTSYIVRLNGSSTYVYWKPSGDRFCWRTKPTAKWTCDDRVAKVTAGIALINKSPALHSALKLIPPKR